MHLPAALRSGEDALRFQALLPQHLELHLPHGLGLGQQRVARGLVFGPGNARLLARKRKSRRDDATGKDHTPHTPERQASEGAADGWSTDWPPQTPSKDAWPTQQDPPPGGPDADGTDPWPEDPHPRQ